MANINRLKAWVRYDGKGRLVGGGPILQESKPKNGDWVEIPYYEYCCQTTTTQAPAFRLLVSNIEQMSIYVGDVTDVNNWNTFFNLPTYGSTFTNVSVNSNTVFLYGGANITLKDSVFDYGDLLVEIDDQIGCVVSTEYGVFYGNNALTSVNLPEATYIADTCFFACTSLTSVNLSSCINLGPTVGYDEVFRDVLGNNITLTVPSALMTVDSGSPDGDIQYLQSNNTVTIVTV